MAGTQFEVLTAEDTSPEAARRRAADLIIETVLNSPEKMTIIPVGPLTNIALALKLEPRSKTRSSGSCSWAAPSPCRRRSTTSCATGSPRRSCSASGVPITAVGLDVTTKCKLEGRDLDRMKAADNPASKFLVRLIELWQDGHPNQYPTLHDPLAVASAFARV